MFQTLGIGSDIVECLRIAQLIERHGELFLNRIFTTSEIQYCQSRSAATQHFSAHWAAKMAVLRALGASWQRGLSWRDIEVRTNGTGRPVVALNGGARDIADRQGIDQILLSVSHCHTHAVAFVHASGHRPA